MNVLHEFFDAAAQAYPEKTALIEPGKGEISYRELSFLADRMRDRLHHYGVRQGDRVGIYLHKSIDAVAAIHGVLRSGAAYVPVDPSAPPARNAYIMHNCGIKALILEDAAAEKIQEELAQLGSSPELLALPGVGGGDSLRRALNAADAEQPVPATATVYPQMDDLAYILYTSGSTGKPKGVMLSHRNAVSFVDWCTETFQPRPGDCFSSHAPFHFDLSILDLHVSLKHGASLVLIGEGIGKDPERLATLIAEQAISIWYSAPSILSLLAQYGRLREYDYSPLRIVLFAGEVFPVKHLRNLVNQWPKPRYYNLYGPTETNVCTFHEVPAPIPEQRSIPYPIGAACSHLQCKMIDAEGREVTGEQQGELVVIGSGVMQGYWALPDLTANAFWLDVSGAAWYKTGDIVTRDAAGDYAYSGRRDRMVKRRGYRVELGEIETGLYLHPLVKEAAVIAVPDEAAGVRIKAFLSCREANHPSLIEIKRFSSANMPVYMIPDTFHWLDTLPKTSTDKIDYQQLKEIN